MTHHRHFVKSRLSVEYNNIVVNNVPFDFVAKLEMEIAWLRVKSQINSITIVTNDVLCARVLRRSSGNELLQSKTRGNLLGKTLRSDLW